MRTERLALYTAVYPGVEPYLRDWYDSVRAQADRDFDLWISVDALRRDQVVSAIGTEPEARWWFAPAGSTPADIRSAALAELAAAYTGVVLVDSDDVLEPSRVEAARAALRGADVAACALRIADAQARPLGPVLAPEDTTPDWAELLLRHNVFGLSNTAYRSATLRRCLPVPAETVLTDWLLVLRALSLGATLTFDPVPRMIYRQHPANVARVLPPFSASYVLRAADLVADHYRGLLAPGGVPASRRRRLREAWRDARAFREAMRRSPARLDRYVSALNALTPRFVWWWCVANLELEDVWKN